ncbi:MAG: ABC-F family ATP-binding cassette domain-containing protein [Candidatus Omnitrophica bacterium]|nr:ABC-F family ATP-binding cassette domain-containing protein [Candidatus Omnitrophota bacterium]
MPAILQLKDIHKAFGPHVIFEAANATLNSEQKIGFIGRNGAGKSTLCKIIIGQDTADAGEVVQSADLRLSYLEQHDPFTPTETVLEFLMRHTGQEGWRCGEVAGRFQLKHALLDTAVKTLSGGYQTRVKLASMLLRDPNFLILDEPSNYLDLKTLILLEEFLEDFDGGFLIVSHDREFLKKTCDHTLEAEDGRLTLYPGTVEEYLVFKQEQQAQAISYNETIESKRKQLQAFVDRFHAKASKASQARSKMKQIEKLKTIELAGPQRSVQINIPAVSHRQGVAFRCEDLSIGYPDKLVAGAIHLHADHGAHVAVLGDNGQGKTTLLRTLAGELPPQHGSFRWGYHCEIAYYAQHVAAGLDPAHDVFTHLERRAAPSVTRQELLAMAGSFLFKGNEVKKPVSVLSGGECARLCLAGLLLMKRSVLLLDEPTNHLDFDTVESLGAALRQFQGTIFFISHDRTFVNMVATQIIEVKNGAVVGYPGTYADYVYHLEHQVRQELTADQGDRRPAAARVAKPPSDYHLRKQRESTRRKLAGEIKRSEERQASHRHEQQALEAELAAHPTVWTRELTDRLAALTQLIHEEERRWIELNERLESLAGSHPTTPA